MEYTVLMKILSQISKYSLSLLLHKYVANTFDTALTANGFGDRSVINCFLS